MAVKRVNVVLGRQLEPSERRKRERVKEQHESTMREQRCCMETGQRMKSEQRVNWRKLFAMQGGQRAEEEEAADGRNGDN